MQDIVNLKCFWKDILYGILESLGTDPIRDLDELLFVQFGKSILNWKVVLFVVVFFQSILFEQLLSFGNKMKRLCFSVFTISLLL